MACSSKSKQFVCPSYYDFTVYEAAVVRKDKLCELCYATVLRLVSDIVILQQFVLEDEL